MDLLRALQRDGVLRLERDRRGGLRVFQGAALQRAQPAAQLPAEGLPADVGYEPEGTDEPSSGVAIEVQPGEVLGTREAAEPDQPEAEPIPVDTTAELLGRAKPKRRAARSGHGARKSAAAPRKGAPRRAARAKKATPAEAADNGEQS